jgi:hypothetical protein
MVRLLPLLERAGVAVMFSGHEHNFQHSQANGIDYFVTGAAGKIRGATPDRFAKAHTQSWSNLCHFLLVRIEGDRMLVRAIGELENSAAGLVDIPRWTPGGTTMTSVIAVRR